MMNRSLRIAPLLALLLGGCVMDLDRSNAPVGGGPADPVCEPEWSNDLALVSTSMTVGDVVVSNDESSLFVTVTADAGYTLSSLFISLGLSGGPLDFYVFPADPGGGSASATIPLTDASLACGDEYKIVIDADVTDASGAVSQVNAFGIAFGPGAGWFNVEVVCCPSDPEPGCPDDDDDDDHSGDDDDDDCDDGDSDESGDDDDADDRDDDDRDDSGDDDDDGDDHADHDEYGDDDDDGHEDGDDDEGDDGDE
ncbi:MAG: hypothetical protein ACFCGT_13025, partial [Sandaracinaceae bacterium]